MKFRTRLVITLSAATALTMAFAFGAVSVIVERSEARQLDEALRTEAKEGAAEVALNRHSLHLTDRDGPDADDIGHLTEYAVIYSEDGTIVDHTSNFTHGAPLLESIRHPLRTVFDYEYEGVAMRGVVVAIPGKAGPLLFLAAPLTDMERDNAFMRHVMLAVALLSIACTILITWRVVSRLTRGHEAIASVARRVADGDLRARVKLTIGDDEVVQLAHDIDEMVRRLAILVESQQRFIANAAHELRSPLTALYGELQLALRRERTKEEYHQTIEEALDAARRLKALAEDLLALARIAETREPPTTPVSLQEVARGAASWVASEAKRRSIELTIDTDESIVLGRAMDLERMLRNLMDNAVRHSPVGGRVRVEAKSAGPDVQIFVSDDGPGVPDSERERIFEPFFRAAAERRRDDGSGLGLAIVREIARMHGGDVSVEGGPNGRGALFRARLPAAPT